MLTLAGFLRCPSTSRFRQKKQSEKEASLSTTNSAGGGIRTHEPLRDGMPHPKQGWILSPAQLTMLCDPRTIVAPLHNQKVFRAWEINPRHTRNLLLCASQMESTSVIQRMTSKLDALKPN